MGDAKRRKADSRKLIYHHTSILRTNLLWMAGEILPENHGKKALHPQLGEIDASGTVTLRRKFEDFPPLVWLTTQITVPNCLKDIAIYFVPKDGGAPTRLDLAVDEAAAFSLRRVALGFHAVEIDAIPWQDHPGYHTTEGTELNETAHDVGDDPDDWFVCENAVDLMQILEFRHAKSLHDLKMLSQPSYLSDIKRMVTMCRQTPGVFIPPSWLTQEQAEKLSAKMELPIKEL